MDITIDVSLVRRLVAAQFPEWKDLPVRPVANSGWDNRTFHLGEHMLVRLPSAAEYAVQVEKEHRWLPKLAPLLPLSIPVPLAIGEPAEGYPWKWSIYQWLEGNSAESAPIADLCDFATSLAQFLLALQQIDPTGGPPPGPHSFYRGGELKIYDSEARRAIAALKDKINAAAALEIWEAALAASWQGSPVWVHGDMSPGNLLVQDGRLCAVIDFGQLTVGDPACDLAIAWTFLSGESREVFRTTLPFDAGTWVRGRAWTLWKALIVAAGFTSPNNAEAQQCWRVIDAVINDKRR
jgi:aminoglycoside phosphotransferase (APT) family kinase protein